MNPFRIPCSVKVSLKEISSDTIMELEFTNKVLIEIGYPRSFLKSTCVKEKMRCRY